MRPKRRFRPDVLYYALGIITLLITWGVLVTKAVGAGSDHNWGKLALMAAIAVACLFGSFVLIGRLWRALTGEPDQEHRPERAAPTAAPSGAYVEEQPFYDQYGGYAQGTDTGSYGYDNPYETSYDAPYDGSYGDPHQDPYGTGGQDGYNAPSRPTYGVGNNRLPPRQSPAALPPAGPPPTHAPGQHGGYDDPSGRYGASGTYDTGSYDAYQTGSYDTGTYDANGYGTDPYASGYTSSYDAVYDTGSYDAAPDTRYTGQATQDTPAAPPRTALPSPRADTPDDGWPPQAPRYRR